MISLSDSFIADWISLLKPTSNRFEGEEEKKTLVTQQFNKI